MAHVIALHYLIWAFTRSISTNWPREATRERNYSLLLFLLVVTSLAVGVLSQNGGFFFDLYNPHGCHGEENQVAHQQHGDGPEEIGEHRWFVCQEEKKHFKTKFHTTKKMQILYHRWCCTSRCLRQSWVWGWSREYWARTRRWSRWPKAPAGRSTRRESKWSSFFSRARRWSR